MKNILFGAVIPPKPVPRGQITYGRAGSYTFIVPADVTMLHVAVMGAGGDGAPSLSGSGGNLRWQNNIVVKPGQSIDVVVGKSTPSRVSSALGLTSNTPLSSVVKGADGQPGLPTSGYAFRHGGNAGGYVGPEQRGAGITLPTFTYRIADATPTSSGLSAGGGGAVITNKTNYSGGDGGVRIIWGPDRAFPDKNIGNL